MDASGQIQLLRAALKSALVFISGDSAEEQWMRNRIENVLDYTKPKDES